MTLKISLLSFLLLLLACHSPKGKPEPKLTYHENGNISTQYFYETDIDGGLYKEFYPNGALQIERQLVNGDIKSEKVIDYNGKVLVNYTIKNGEYFGLLGSASCFNVFSEDKLTVVE